MNRLYGYWGFVVLAAGCSPAATPKRAPVEHNRAAAAAEVAAKPPPPIQSTAQDAAPPHPTSEPEAHPRKAPPCPADMVAIDGEYCPKLVQKCLRKRKPWQCAEYQKSATCVGPTKRRLYCIDRYEYPNRAGALPTVMNTWQDAKKTCASLGKRLCTEAEWTLACEGPERRAFPYGFVRDAQACPIDKPSPRVNERRLFSRPTQAAELARLDQREVSGHRPQCVSPYGVFDLTGNVDEWVRNETGRPYRSSLKGGNWGEYRNACRPATRGHGENWRYYQTGFRCCREQDRGQQALDRTPLAL